MDRIGQSLDKIAVLQVDLPGSFSWEIYWQSSLEISTIGLYAYVRALPKRRDLMDKLVYTKKQIAALFEISERKLEKMIESGTFLKPAHIGDLPRWRVTDVAVWVEKHLAPGARV